MAQLKDLLVVGPARFLSKIKGNLQGNADTATKLETPREISINLSSNTPATFDGSDDIIIGVDSTLPIVRGGTGITSNPSLLVNLATTAADNVFEASPRPGVTGVLPIANGGTGVTSNPALLVNLASTSTDTVFEASPRPGVTGTLPIANGGTGATTAANALKNLGLTATAAELNYVDGVTSSIQTQLNTLDSNIDKIDIFNTGTSIPSGADLNTYTTLGKYFAGSADTAASLLNCPTTENFTLFVLRRTSGAALTQVLIGLNGRTYVRSAPSSGTFKAWQKYATDTDIEDLQDQIDNNTQKIKHCKVGQSTSTTTNPWYKFASVSIPTSTSHIDRNITFKVSQGYGDKASYTGILTAHVRTGTNGIFEQAQLIWEYANESVETSDFILAYKYTEGVSVETELWAKQDYGWAKFHFEVLSEHNRNSFEDAWTLYNADTAGQAASPTSGYTHIESTLGVLKASKVYGAVWNDYAEYRESAEKIKPGQVVIENGDGSMSISNKRLIPGASIVSDTYGFIIGETEKCKLPVATAGRVLRYPLEDKTIYKAGDAVCTGPNGTVSKMTREEIKEYPDCILGYVSEIPNYEEWSEKHIKVNGRVWIKI